MPVSTPSDSRSFMIVANATLAVILSALSPIITAPASVSSVPPAVPSLSVMIRLSASSEPPISPLKSNARSKSVRFSPFIFILFIRSITIFAKSNSNLNIGKAAYCVFIPLISRSTVDTPFS